MASLESDSMSLDAMKAIASSVGIDDPLVADVVREECPFRFTFVRLCA